LIGDQQTHMERSTGNFYSAAGSPSRLNAEQMRTKRLRLSVGTIDFTIILSFRTS